MHVSIEVTLLLAALAHHFELRNDELVGFGAVFWVVLRVGLVNVCPGDLDFVSGMLGEINGGAGDVVQLGVRGREREAAFLSPLDQTAGGDNRFGLRTRIGLLSTARRGARPIFGTAAREQARREQNRQRDPAYGG